MRIPTVNPLLNLSEKGRAEAIKTCSDPKMLELYYHYEHTAWSVLEAFADNTYLPERLQLKMITNRRMVNHIFDKLVSNPNFSNKAAVKLVFKHKYQTYATTAMKRLPTERILKLMKSETLSVAKLAKEEFGNRDVLGALNEDLQERVVKARRCKDPGILRAMSLDRAPDVKLAVAENLCTSVDTLVYLAVPQGRKEIRLTAMRNPNMPLIKLLEMSQRKLDSLADEVLSERDILGDLLED